MHNPELRILVAKSADIVELNKVNKQLQKVQNGITIPGVGIDTPSLTDFHKDKDKVLVLKLREQIIGFS
ncbi:MAG: hypothetical protein WCI04_06495 [archaeon]